MNKNRGGKNALVRYCVVFLVFFSVIAKGPSCLAAGNPAAEYCGAMGYTFVVEKEKTKSVGYCILPDSSRVNAWKFLRGEVATQYSYCAQQGCAIELRTTTSNGYTTKEPYCMPYANGKQSESGSTRSMIDLMQNDGLMKKASQYNKSLPNVITSLETPKTKTGKTYSTSFDWRDYNGHSYIGPVRDQGSCGSCYAFGAAAAAEGSYNYMNGLYDDNVVDFAEMYIMWCLGAYGNYNLHFAGCDGSDTEYMELEALTKEGITWEANIPYSEDASGPAQSVCSVDSDQIVTFSEWGRLESNSEDQIKSAISTYGVIDVAVYADTQFNLYSGGIFSDFRQTCPDGAYTTVNHAVALVGWGTDEEYGTYWILRNSWGSDWGEDGYMRIQAESARVSCAPTFLKAEGTNSDDEGASLGPVYYLLLN